MGFELKRGYGSRIKIWTLIVYRLSHEIDESSQRECAVC